MNKELIKIALNKTHDKTLKINKEFERKFNWNVTDFLDTLNDKNEFQIIGSGSKARGYCTPCNYLKLREVNN